MRVPPVAMTTSTCCCACCSRSARCRSYSAFHSACFTTPSPAAAAESPLGACVGCSGAGGRTAPSAPGATGCCLRFLLTQANDAVKPGILWNFASYRAHSFSVECPAGCAKLATECRPSSIRNMTGGRLGRGARRHLVSRTVARFARIGQPRFRLRVRCGIKLSQDFRCRRLWKRRRQKLECESPHLLGRSRPIAGARRHDAPPLVSLILRVRVGRPTRTDDGVSFKGESHHAKPLVTALQFTHPQLSSPQRLRDWLRLGLELLEEPDHALDDGQPRRRPATSLIEDTGVSGNDNITIKSDTTNSQFVISDPGNAITTSIAGASGSGTSTVTRSLWFGDRQRDPREHPRGRRFPHR